MASKNQILLDIINYADKELNKPFTPGKTYIPPSYPELLSDDVAQLAETVLNFWYTEHRQAIKFGKLLEDYVGKRQSVLTNSGSSASLIAMTAALEKWDDNRNLVLTCSTGFPTTVAPIYQNGKLPLYIDIDPETLSPNLDEIEEALDRYSDNICGAIFAHNLGFPYEEDVVADWLHEEEMFLIADCCDALGSMMHDIEGDGAHVDTMSHVGAYADLMTLSFFPAHHINTAEGGAVLTNSDELYEIARSLGSWGRSCTCLPGQSNTCGKRFEWEDRGQLPEGWDHKYIFDRLGYNLKMTDLQAALGVSQMSRISNLVYKRVTNFFDLTNEICEGYLRTVEIPEWAHPSPFGIPLFVSEDAPFSLYDIVSYLEKHQVGTRRLFGGNLIKQPGFMNEQFVRLSDLQGSDYVMNNCFWISCSPTLTVEMKNYIVETFDNFFREKVY